MHVQVLSEGISALLSQAVSLGWPAMHKHEGSPIKNWI